MSTRTKKPSAQSHAQDAAASGAHTTASGASTSTAPPAAVQHAIPFLQPDEDGKFHVLPEAATILSGIKGKVVVVAVAGPYRTGKSYLLNCLIDSNVSSGFQVGSSINACTKGIWLWGAPKYDPETDRTYIYLDTEGLNSAGENVTYDTQIFALSVLLASVFVFNTQNAITESSLQELELVAESSKMIRFDSSHANSQKPGSRRGGADDDEKSDVVDRDVAEHFPSFTWVLRDFTLLLQDKEGNPISANQYLENMLAPLPAGNRGAQEKNRVRETIRSCFLRRSCCPLVRPVESEEQLRSLAKLSRSELRPEFIKGLNNLKGKLHDPSATSAKKIGDAFVSGPMLVQLAQTYADAINTGRVPEIMSAWQSALKIRISASLDAAKQKYDQEIAHALSEQVASETKVNAATSSRTDKRTRQLSGNFQHVFDEDTLQDTHARALAAARTELVEALLNNHDAVEEANGKLTAYAENSLRERLKINLERSHAICKSITSDMWSDTRADAKFSSSALSNLIRTSLEEGKKFGGEELSAFCDAFCAEFQRRGARGPALSEYEKEIALWISGQACDVLSTCCHEARDSFEKVAAEFEDFKTKAQQEYDAIKRELETTRAECTRITHQATEAELRAKSFEASLANKTAEMKELKLESSARLERELENLRRVDNERAVAIAEAQRERGEKEKREHALQALQIDYARTRALLDEAKEARMAHSSATEQELKTARAAAKQSASEALEAQEELSTVRTTLAKSQAEAASAKAEVKKLTADLRNARSELTRLEKETKELETAMDDLKSDHNLALETQRSLKARAEQAERRIGLLEAKLSAAANSEMSAKEEAKEQERARRAEAKMADKSAEHYRQECARLKAEVEQLKAEREQQLALESSRTTSQSSRSSIGSKRKSWKESTILEDFEPSYIAPVDDGYYSEEDDQVVGPSQDSKLTAVSSTSTALPSKPRKGSKSQIQASDGWETPNMSLNRVGAALEPKAKRLQRASLAPQQDSDGFFRAAAAVPTYETADDLPVTAEPYSDPEGLTANQLRSWLTSIDIPIPPTAKRKAELVALVKKHDPRCW